MRILFETNDKDLDKPKSDEVIAKRNICNIFNIRAIQRELKSKYNIEASCLPIRRWSDDIWYMNIVAPYIGKCVDLHSTPLSTTVALFVDYAATTAFAMPRGGSDKESMMLIASIANKYIQEPFKYDSTIRNRIHSLGGDS